MFLFSCYAGGLRFIDVLELRWENYFEEGKRIVKIIRKTRRKHNFRLPKQAAEIMQKYSSPENKPTDFIFPMFSNNQDYRDIRKFNNAKNNKNTLVNTILRNIGEELGLEFKLTFHIARHTFATMVLKKECELNM